MLDDETLRDGLQSPSVRSPAIEEKIRIVHLIADLRIEAVDIGLPGAGPHVAADVERLAREVVNHRLRLALNCAARFARGSGSRTPRARPRCGVRPAR